MGIDRMPSMCLCCCFDRCRCRDRSISFRFLFSCCRQICQTNLRQCSRHDWHIHCKNNYYPLCLHKFPEPASARYFPGMISTVTTMFVLWRACSWDSFLLIRLLPVVPGLASNRSMPFILVLAETLIVHSKLYRDWKSRAFMNTISKTRDRSRVNFGREKEKIRRTEPKRTEATGSGHIIGTVTNDPSKRRTSGVS